MVSDNGPQFVSDEFERFLKANRIKYLRSSPYHPLSNGLAERFVQTFKRAMKAGRHCSLHQRLAGSLLRYRITP